MQGIAHARGALLLGLALAGPAAATANITLFYNERPPYLIAAPDGSVSGLTGTPAGRAFAAAGIPFMWAKTPTNRQLASIKQNKAMECAVGWFKNPEREQFAQFTKAIYRDRPAVALANKGFQVSQYDTLERVLATRGIRVLLKENFSYGPFIDNNIARFMPHLTHTTAENALMVEMIRKGRADLMFMAEEEAEFMLANATATAGSGDFYLLRFSDMPAGEKRYIMCSKQVPDEIIGRLNRAITFE
ncbi:MAG TPA: transporter substrate-binding domain-containing protein [Burkholderiaceae bacterium]|nr:transporter substrate-binding domain-containing protein [Burkholderiaceae bacterium]